MVYEFRYQRLFDRSKKSNPNIEIIIVVDDNEINKKYFLNSKSAFEDVGIKIKSKVTGRFLHNKFMVIDEMITITGSYNYSKKANLNLEKLTIAKEVKNNVKRWVKMISTADLRSAFFFLKD